MKIIEEFEKMKMYRKLENEIFDKSSDFPIKIPISISEKFNFEEVRQESFYKLIQEKFKFISPKFCITTIFNDDPIFELDLNLNTSQDYLSIMIDPESKDLKFPEVGLSIIYEKIFGFSINLDWYFYADRYNNELTLFGRYY